MELRDGKKVSITEGGGVMFWCPGCKMAHRIIAKGTPGDGPRWTYDGNPDAPTFSPSVLVNGNLKFMNPGAPRCHSFVRAGRIQFLNDCSHDLAGKTVDLPDWSD